LGDFCIAIDPGPVQSAVVIWDGSTIFAKAISPNEFLLDNLKNVFDQGDDGDVVIEMIASYGMPVGRDVFETCVWIGRFIEASSIPCHRLFRMDVKNHLCHSAKAKDSHIRQALIDRYGPPKGTKCPCCKGKGWAGRERTPCDDCSGEGWAVKPGPLAGVVKDEWAALGVAVTWWDTRHDNSGKS